MQNQTEFKCPYCGANMPDGNLCEECFTFGPQSIAEETTLYDVDNVFGGLCEECQKPNDAHGNCTNIDCYNYMPF